MKNYNIPFLPWMLNRYFKLRSINNLQRLVIQTDLIKMEIDSAIIYNDKIKLEKWMSFLLNSIDHDKFDKYINGALLTATLANRTDIVRCLLLYGADPHFLNEYNESPLLQIKKMMACVQDSKFSSYINKDLLLQKYKEILERLEGRI